MYPSASVQTGSATRPSQWSASQAGAPDRGFQSSLKMGPGTPAGGPALRRDSADGLPGELHSLRLTYSATGAYSRTALLIITKTLD